MLLFAQRVNILILGSIKKNQDFFTSHEIMTQTTVIMYNQHIFISRSHDLKSIMRNNSRF